MHVHTFYSDGSLSPEDAVNAAKANGVKILAVTDHDNMNGSEEVACLAHSMGLIAVDGVEISAYDGGVKVHVLGYGLDKSRTEYKRFFKKLYDGAAERTEDILKKLNARHINITIEDVERERVCQLSPFHGSHIAKAACRKGYAKTPWEFYAGFLDAGKCGYSAVSRPTPEEAVRAIAQCGGVSSLAHPGRIALDRDKRLELIDRLCKAGLSGIEAVYSGHTKEETAYYTEIARAHNLLVTGGSDTHSPTGNRRVGEPEFHPDGQLLSALKII